MKFNPVQTNEKPAKEKLGNVIWGIVNSTIFRYTPPFFKIFKVYRVALLRFFGAQIAWNCYIHPKAKIEYPWNLKMESLSSLGERCWIYSLNKIQIGEKSCIGKDVNLITGSHDITSSKFHLITQPISIGVGVWITTRATILPGRKIGDYAIVANNSVVTKDVPAWTVVGGNPAKFIKKREIKE